VVNNIDKTILKIGATIAPVASNMMPKQISQIFALQSNYRDAYLDYA